MACGDKEDNVQQRTVKKTLRLRRWLAELKLETAGQDSVVTVNSARLVNEVSLEHILVVKASKDDR